MFSFCQSKSHVVQGGGIARDKVLGIKCLGQISAELTLGRLSPAAPAGIWGNHF